MVQPASADVVEPASADNGFLLLLLLVLMPAVTKDYFCRCAMIIKPVSVGDRFNVAETRTYNMFSYRCPLWYIHVPMLMHDCVLHTSHLPLFLFRTKVFVPFIGKI